jgi:dynein intermediate chain
MIAGGTTSGQVVLWDIRCHSPGPVLKSNSGHSDSIHSIHTVGSSNAFSILTASENLVCTWRLDMLNQPVDTIELYHSNYSKLDGMATTCLGFPVSESATFWVGTQDGTVHQAKRFERAGWYSYVTHILAKPVLIHLLYIKDIRQ